MGNTRVTLTSLKIKLVYGLVYYTKVELWLVVALPQPEVAPAPPLKAHLVFNLPGHGPLVLAEIATMKLESRVIVDHNVTVKVI